MARDVKSILTNTVTAQNSVVGKFVVGRDREWTWIIVDKHHTKSSVTSKTVAQYFEAWYSDKHSTPEVTCYWTKKPTVDVGHVVKVLSSLESGKKHPVMHTKPVISPALNSTGAQSTLAEKLANPYSIKARDWKLIIPDLSDADLQTLSSHVKEKSDVTSFVKKEQTARRIYGAQNIGTIVKTEPKTEPVKTEPVKTPQTSVDKIDRMIAILAEQSASLSSLANSIATLVAKLG